MLPDLVHFTDEPLADLASVPLLAVSRLAQQNVKVVLSGEGSDEILAGYNFDLAERRWDIVRTLQRVPKPLVSMAATILRSERAARVAGLPLAKWNERERPHSTRFLGQDEKASLWPNAEYEDSERVLQKLYSSAMATDPLQQVLSVYQKDWLVENLLMKADKMSMAASVELRTPFLDYRLVAWANRQPNQVKIKRTGLMSYETKSVLRRFCARRLPHDVVTRPKRGFPVPVNAWLQNGLATWARDLLQSRDARVFPGFSARAIDDLLDRVEQGAGDAPGKVWLLIVLEYWLQAWDARIS
jgi:asparagine synthase (glutamine-hydrolysing)